MYNQINIFSEIKARYYNTYQYTTVEDHKSQNVRDELRGNTRDKSESEE